MRAGARRSSGSATDLAASRRPCTIAFWHHPRLLVGHARQRLDGDHRCGLRSRDAGAELVLTGHDHGYERFDPQTSAGGRPIRPASASSSSGPAGAACTRSGRRMRTARSGSRRFGYLQLTLGTNAYSWSVRRRDRRRNPRLRLRDLPLTCYVKIRRAARPPPRTDRARARRPCRDKRVERRRRPHAVVDLRREPRRARSPAARRAAGAGRRRVQLAALPRGTHGARRSRAHSSSTPSTVGRDRAHDRRSPRPGERRGRASASRSRTVSSTPGRSALFTTNTSAISSRPALFACTPSPHPGFTTTTVVSAAPRSRPPPDRRRPSRRGSTASPAASSTRMRLRRRERETAEVTAGGHRADEHARVGGVVLHADAVTEDRAAAERAGRVDREHADLVAVGARCEPTSAIGERRLPRARRAGDADRVRAAGAPGRARPTASRRGVAARLDQRDQLARRRAGHPHTHGGRACTGSSVTASVRRRRLR